jgi:hypothetical protein
MRRLTLLFIVTALVVPGSALAMPSHDVKATSPGQDLTAPDRDAGTRTVLNRHGIDQAAAQRKAEAVGRYYASYRDTEPLPAPEPVAGDGEGLSWTLAIGGAIALMLAAGGLGVYAGRTIHPRHIGA